MALAGVILAPYVLHRGVGTLDRVALVGLTFAAAWITKVLVEDPVRFRCRLTRLRPRWTFAAVATGTATVLAVAGSAASHERTRVREAREVTRATLAAEPACLGAAARDPRRPCRNRELVDAVVPSPLEAPDLSNGPCERMPFEVGGEKVCGFGAAGHTAKATVALVGDSHSTHWRAGVDVVGKARGWRALQLGHTSCPLSMATRPLPEPGFSTCLRWKRAVIGWLARHPEVETVFVSQLAGGQGVVPTPGRTAFETAVRGYVDAWAALPRSVRHVVVIRDNPRALPDTLACLQRAVDRHQRADRVCPLPRRRVVDRDPAVVAARRLGSSRVRVVDLTRLFCDRRYCHAVIGGALVHQDQTHMTAIFNATLGPYLLRAVDRLLPRAP